MYLKGDYDLIHERLAQRQGHFMPPGLLASQFAALEEPEWGVVVDIVHPPETIVALIREQLGRIGNIKPLGAFCVDHMAAPLSHPRANANPDSRHAT